MRELFAILETPKENKKSSGFDIAIEHLNEVEKFYQSRYVTQSRKQEFGVNLSEKADAQIAVSALRERIGELEKNGCDIVAGNNFSHILGNSAVMIPGRFAQRFDEGKYDDKPFPLEKAREIKSDIDLLNYYIKELSKSDEAIKKELGTGLGYIGDKLNYFCDDVPSVSLDRLKIFKFLKELERGIEKDEFEKSMEVTKKYLDKDKLKNDITENDDGMYVLKK